jgi:hypothetical protein
VSTHLQQWLDGRASWEQTLIAIILMLHENTQILESQLLATLSTLPQAPAHRGPQDD